MQLVIDIGNTRCKLAVFGDEKPLFQDTVKRITVAYLKQLFVKYPSIESCLLSTVAAPNGLAALHTYLSKYTIVYELNSSTKLPISVRYKSKATLGTDRIAVASGASMLFPKKTVLIINCGTCITYDCIEVGQHYLGGSISLGVQMRFKALHDYTARLPLVKIAPVSNLIGDTTANSILSGVVIGCAAELDGMIDRYRLKYKGLKVVLTGGDAETLEKHLKNKIFAVPNLTLLGLHHILTNLS
jgi:type III pantothenate kinase